jgi:hypothetical protein
VLKEKAVNQEYYLQQNDPSKKEREIKTFLDKQKLKQFITSSPALQEVLIELGAGGSCL